MPVESGKRKVKDKNKHNKINFHSKKLLAEVKEDRSNGWNVHFHFRFLFLSARIALNVIILAIFIRT